MWKSHFNASYRNLLRHRFFTLINVAGIAIGLMAFFYIVLYVQHENTYDSHIKGGDQIARVTIEKYRSGEMIVAGAETYVATGPALQEDLPEVVAHTRTYNSNLRMNSVITYEKDDTQKIALKITDYYYADSSFLSFFEYQLLSGDVNTALSKPNTAVITESLARIYFGEEDPMGKVLIYEDEDLERDEHVITGVMADPPANTHLPFRLLLSYNTFNTRSNPFVYKHSWKSRKSYTYIKIHPEANFVDVEKKLPEVVDLHMNLPEERKEVLKLQPLAAIHFTEGLADEPSTTSNAEILRILHLVAFLILGVAIINYINISTSSLLTRAGEVSVRKVLGADKFQLIIQFLIECSLTVFLAAILAFSLLYFLWPALNDLSGVNIPLSNLWEKEFIGLTAFVITLSIFLSGIIPAVIFASVNPVNALKGIKAGNRTGWLRLSLVISQFTVSFCLVAATMIVYSQLNFMQEQELGIDIEQALVVRTPGVMPSEHWEENESAYKVFLKKVQEHSSIKNHTASLTIPGHLVPFRTGGYLQNDPENLITLRLNGVNNNFFETFNMNLLAGRGFNDDNDGGKTIILTVAALEKLGFESPESAIGSIVKIPAFRMTCEIIGVVNDYRLESVKTDIEPMAFVFNSLINTNFFSFRLHEKSEAPIDHINSSWNSVFPGNPLEYFFMEEYFNKQYYQERRMARLFAVFGLLTVILGGMGLLGLSVFIAKKLFKEIGIRKILGSSVSQIFILISSKFVRLVVISSFIGIPITIYFGNQWLEQFPQRIEMAYWLYLSPAFLIIVVALVSTCFQTLKAALLNPIHVIKDL